MRIAMVASECEPFAKSGGLGDVVDALARALGERGHQVDVYLPWYRGTQAPSGTLDRRALAVPVGRPPDGGREASPKVALVQLVSGRADGYRIRLVDHPASFDRPGLYGPPGSDYADNTARFALLGRTALETIRLEAAEAGPTTEPVAVLHGHDWEAGPALLLLRTRYAAEPALARLVTVLTCHNLAYHGWTPGERVWQLGLGDEEGAGLGTSDGIDLLREALQGVDLANTVSPTFAEEARTAEFGSHLDDVLRARGERFLGILNGLDGRLWDPARDTALAAGYSAEQLAGKARDKADLLRRHGLSSSDPGEEWGERGAPLLGLVGRLDPQKGFDLLAEAAGPAVELGARIVILGTGEARLLKDLRRLASRRPDRVSIRDAFDRDEARRIYAGADAFLMPSRFEPCGQSQMIALRYGTPPIVRATGGLADTVIDADRDPEQGTGFVFGPAEPGALLEAIGRAVVAYRDAPRWQRLIRRGMAVDFDWRGAAGAYEAAYERARHIHLVGSDGSRPSDQASVIRPEA
jgi:starch synthase